MLVVTRAVEIQFVYLIPATTGAFILAAMTLPRRRRQAVTVSVDIASPRAVSHRLTGGETRLSSYPHIALKLNLLSRRLTIADFFRRSLNLVRNCVLA
jgi:hypothetical protein